MPIKCSFEVGGQNVNENSLPLSITVYGNIELHLCRLELLSVSRMVCAKGTISQKDR